MGRILVRAHAARGQAHQMVDWCVWCAGGDLGGLGAGRSCFSAGVGGAPLGASSALLVPKTGSRQHLLLLLKITA